MPPPIPPITIGDINAAEVPEVEVEAVVEVEVVEEAEVTSEAVVEANVILRGQYHQINVHGA